MGLIAEAREALRYRELLRNLVVRELRVRYKNSPLGVLWSLANPVARALIVAVVFKFFVPLKVENYGAYVLAAFFPWTYFLTGVLDAGESVSKQMALVKKVYFPRELLPLATTIANLLHFLVSLLVLFGYVAFLNVRAYFAGEPHFLPSLSLLWLPVLIVMQTLLIGGIALFLSALNVFFEDAKFLVNVLLDLLFYAVPVIYFIEQIAVVSALPAGVRQNVHTFLLLNPMTVILASWRAFLLGPNIIESGPGLPLALKVSVPVPWLFFWLAFVVCVLTFLGGYAFFNARKWRFVEQL